MRHCKASILLNYESSGSIDRSDWMGNRVDVVNDCGRGKLETLDMLLRFSSMSVCKQRTGILLFIAVPLLDIMLSISILYQVGLTGELSS